MHKPSPMTYQMGGKYPPQTVGVYSRSTHLRRIKQLVILRPQLSFRSVVKFLPVGSPILAKMSCSSQRFAALSSQGFHKRILMAVK